MDIQVLGKEEKFDLTVESKQKRTSNYYFGAGWDAKGSEAIDLDIVCAALKDGKLTKQDNLVYFGNRTAPGILLSEDNQTGEGDGDDESVVINLKDLDPEINEIVVGLVCYTHAPMNDVENVHFRVCDGNNEESPQIADIKIANLMPEDTTMLNAFSLEKTGDEWKLVNLSEFYSEGNGGTVIKAFGKQF